MLYSCSDDNTVIQWDISNQIIVYKFEGHTDKVKNIVLSKDNKTLYSCSNDKTII